MVARSRSTVPQSSGQPTRVPLSLLRTETVLSRFPMHHLTQGRVVTIHLTQTNAQGTLELRWDVSYNARYGPPGPLAYKLDTIVVNQILDGLPRPLPRVLKVGSLRQVSIQLAVQVSGRQYAHLTRLSTKMPVRISSPTSTIAVATGLNGRSTRDSPATV